MVFSFVTAPAYFSHLVITQVPSGLISAIGNDRSTSSERKALKPEKLAPVTYAPHSMRSILLVVHL